PRAAVERLAASHRRRGQLLSSFVGLRPFGLLKASPQGEGFSPSPGIDIEDPRLKARDSGEPGRLKAPRRLASRSADERLAASDRRRGQLLSSFAGSGPSG